MDTLAKIQEFQDAGVQEFEEIQELQILELQTQLRMLQQIPIPAVETLIQQVQARINILYGKSHFRRGQQHSAGPDRHHHPDRFNEQDSCANVVQTSQAPRDAQSSRSPTAATAC